MYRAQAKGVQVLNSPYRSGLAALSSYAHATALCLGSSLQHSAWPQWFLACCYGQTVIRHRQGLSVQRWKWVCAGYVLIKV